MTKKGQVVTKYIDGSAYVNTRCVYGLFLSYMQIETSRAEDPVDITRYTLWLSLAAATLEVWLPHTSSSVIFSCYYGDKFLKTKVRVIPPGLS